MQIIGCDGEKSLINVGCAKSPVAVILLCLNHAKQKIKEKLKDLLGDTDPKRPRTHQYLETNLRLD